MPKSAQPRLRIVVPAEPALAAEETGAHESSLGYLVRYAHRAFVKALAQKLATHGISTTEWSVLRVLWIEEGLTQVALAERMRVEKASLTSVLTSLEEKGLVERTRNQSDRRKINLRLSAAGRRLKARVLSCGQAINDRATRGIPPAKVEQVRALLRAFIANLEQPEAG